MEETWYVSLLLDGRRSRNSLLAYQSSILLQPTFVSAEYLANQQALLDLTRPIVQYAGNKNPFLVTVIISCVQLLSMIVTATATDRFERRPLTVYPYGITVISVLSLETIGCYDYTKPSTSSLLVSVGHSKWPFTKFNDTYILHFSIFFACLDTFSTTGASTIGYAYAAEIPQQRLRARTAAWSLAFSNIIATMVSFCTPFMLNGSAQ